MFQSLINSRLLNLLPQRALSLGAWAVFAWPTAASAQATCTLDLQAPPPKTLGAVGQALQQAQTQSAACQDQAAYHAYVGRLLLALGDYPAAASALERALLQAPEELATKLDYAQALAGAGQAPSAKALIRSISDDPTLEPRAQDALLSLLPPTQSLRWSLDVRTKAGHESNPAGATSTDSLVLHLPTGDVRVPLDASEQAKPAGVTMVQLAAELGWNESAQADWRLSLGVQARSPNGQHLDSRYLEYALTREAQAPGGHWAAVFLGRRFRISNQSLTTSGAQLRWRGDGWRPLGCSPELTLGRFNNRYAPSNALDGRVWSANVDWACPVSTGLVTASAGYSLDEDIQHQRFGGDRRKPSVGLQYESRQGMQRHQFQAWWRYSYTRDAEPYLSLITDRRIAQRRNDIGAAYWYQLTRNWAWGVELETNQQKSTNPLLNIENIQFYTGLRWTKKQH